MLLDVVRTAPSLPHPPHDKPRENPRTKRHHNGQSAASAINGEQLDLAVARVGDNLSRSFQAVLDDLPGAPLRPQELSRLLGVNKDLASRILKVVETRDPVAVVHVIPGPEPLRRLLRAAGKKQVESALLQKAVAAVEEFDELIRQVASDRSGLDSIISAWLPEVRERVELISKQAVFRGMSQLRGCLAETELTAQFIHPAASGVDRDSVVLSNTIGVRRLRPGAPIVQTAIGIHGSPNRQPILTMDGELVNSHRDVILEQFCSTPTPHFEIHQEKDVMHLKLAGDDVGLQSAVDLAYAYQQRSLNFRGVFSTINMPTEMAVCDLFLHPGISPCVPPVLEIYDTTIKGVAMFRDPERMFDRLQIKASIEYLGQGASKFRFASLPRYVELIQYVCDKMKWDSSEFHGYRCAIEYPVYGSQIYMVFDPTLLEPPTVPPASTPKSG